VKITVVGAGGVGGYFGTRLAQGGCDVGFVARGEQLRALREHGLQVESTLGDALLPAVRASEDPASLGTPDVVLVCVKLWDLEDAVSALASVVRPGTAVLSLSNGVQKDDVLRGAFGDDAVMGGVAYISAGIARPGVIRHTGALQKLVIGEFGGGASPRASALHEAAVRGGVDATLTPDVRRATWEKFVFLVGMSAATASMRSSIGPIRAHARARAFLLDVMREVVAVGRARGVALPEDFAEQRLAFCDTLPPEMEASMSTDLKRGRRLELAWLSGAVADLGDAAGVPTPLNRAVRDVLALHAAGAPGA
jgi:2-dehydropantoate 2-reductase